MRGLGDRTFSSFLMERMDERGLSSWNLAKSSGVSQASIIYLRGGVRDPRLGTVLKVLNGLGLSLKDLHNYLEGDQ